MRMMDAREVITKRRKALDELLAENAVLDRQASGHETIAAKAKTEMIVVIDALEFSEEVANARRGAMKGRMEAVVTEGLRLVYGPGYSVVAEYDMKNNRTSMELILVKPSPDGEVRRTIDGRTGSGLGVSDTVSVPLRLLILMGSQAANPGGDTDGVCFLDEPYHFMSTERIGRVGEFMRQLCNRIGMQVVMLSHHRELRDYTEKAYEVSDAGGMRSVVKSWSPTVGGDE